MKQILKYLIFAFIIFNFNNHKLLALQKKIVGLLQVRNEENILKQCLLCLSLYVDAIVILDDGSTDNTLNIIKTAKEYLPIEKIIQNKESAWQQGNESENRQKLLNAGRAIGGTHFIIIDADEIFTANCLENNYLRNQILQLEPGESYDIWLICLWRSINQYRIDPNSVWTNNFKSTIFCDDGQCSYPQYFLHGGRIPSNLSGQKKFIKKKYGLMHFQFVNWENLLIKQAWYRCLEHIRNPNKPIKEINNTYGHSKNEKSLQVKQAPKEWFEKYSFFDQSIYDKQVLWRKIQVNEWFSSYGKNFFKDVDLWDVNWNI